MAKIYAGADGCRDGWAVTWIDEERRFHPLTIYPTFAELAGSLAGVSVLLVDIPIGLRESGEERSCDQITRRLLGPRGSTLFRVPVRAAVHAPDYPTASTLNRAATGKGLSVQSYQICGKIAEVDRLMQANPGLQSWVHESHPEACFAALNGWRPLLQRKKSPEGQEQRLALLARHTLNAPETFAAARDRYRRRRLALDDILDAMVLALAARMAHQAGFPGLPEGADKDLYGLTMAIVVPITPPR